VKNYAQTCTSRTRQTLKLSKPGPEVSLKKEQQPPVGSTKPDVVLEWQTEAPWFVDLVKFQGEPP